MIGFLIKGVLRDRSRSLFPVLIVLSGVSLTVFLHCWIRGIESDLIRASASFATGHVRIMSRAYAAESDQMPNELAYVGSTDLLRDLRLHYPDLAWTPRIRFAGLLDIPDAAGETRAQGPIVGLGIDLLDPASIERSALNLRDALVRGRLPQQSGEVLISDELAHKLGVEIGEVATLIGSTMYGSLTTANFEISGTISFGISAMDRGAIVADIGDVQYALEMQDATGEILGFFPDFLYRDGRARQVAATFNAAYATPGEEFAPVMATLRSDPGIAQTLDWTGVVTGILMAIFIVIMSIILWNAGLMGSLRRYGEIGLRLAMGETKRHVYRSLLAEALLIGTAGSFAGTLVGLGAAYYLQEQGLDIGAMLKNSTMIISDVVRAQITPTSYVIGLAPGLISTFLGTAIAGIGVFRRETSRLMKEMEE